MTAALASQWQQARAEWNANPRLRWGALAIAVILFLYLCMLLVEWRADLQQRYQQRSLQLYKVAALTGQDQWLLRAESASTVQKALQAEIPRASSIGLAQAEVQTTIRQLLTAFGPKLSTDARPPAQVTGQPGVWRLPVTIRGVLTPAGRHRRADHRFRRADAEHHDDDHGLLPGRCAPRERQCASLT